MDVSTNHPGGYCHQDGSIIRSSTVPNPSGFTLLETLVTLAIIAILTASLFTPVRALLADNRSVAQVNRLIGDLAYARSAAIIQRQHTVICKSTNGQRCVRSGHWQQGWIIFIDANHNQHHDPEERILRVSGPLTPGHKLTYSAFGSKHYLTYRPSGMTLTNGSFIFCPANHAARPRAVIVYKSGRVRTSRTRAGGGPLICR